MFLPIKFENGKFKSMETKKSNNKLVKSVYRATLFKFAYYIELLCDINRD